MTYARQFETPGPQLFINSNAEGERGEFEQVTESHDAHRLSHQAAWLHHIHIEHMCSLSDFVAAEKVGVRISKRRSHVFRVVGGGITAGEGGNAIPHV